MAICLPQVHVGEVRSC